MVDVSVPVYADSRHEAGGLGFGGGRHSARGGKPDDGEDARVELGRGEGMDE